MLKFVKGKWLPLIVIVLFAISRIPGILPPNFSAAYAFAFCAGVFFKGRMSWSVPLVTLLITDIALNVYYQSYRGWNVWTPVGLGYMAFNYVSYALLFWLGRRFKPQSSFAGLVGGGILGAMLFYIITNLASWFFNIFDNPEYTKTVLGLLTALIKGTGGWPDAWMFFRNTLLGGGLFTALFVAIMKITAPSESPAEKEAGVRDEEPGDEAPPEEAKA